MSTQRKYTCESCAEVDDEFIMDFKAKVITDTELKSDTNERDNTSKKLTVQTKTEAAI